MHRTQSGATELVELRSGGDFMGFEQDPFNRDTYWGSGHWAAGGYGNWGFVESTDGGATWDEISLTGNVDFHQLAASADQQGLIAGTFSGELYVSSDSGRSWDRYGWSGQINGLEIIDPDGPVVLISWPSGIERVAVPAMDSDVILEADVTGLGLWEGGFLYGHEDGALFACNLDGAECEELAGPGGAVLQFLLGPADLDDIYVLTADSAVHHSHDRGETWALLVEHD